MSAFDANADNILLTLMQHYVITEFRTTAVSCARVRLTIKYSAMCHGCDVLKRICISGALILNVRTEIQVIKSVRLTLAR